MPIWGIHQVSTNLIGVSFAEEWFLLYFYFMMNLIILNR